MVRFKLFSLCTALFVMSLFSSRVWADPLEIRSVQPSFELAYDSNDLPVVTGNHLFTRSNPVFSFPALPSAEPESPGPMRLELGLPAYGLWNRDLNWSHHRGHHKPLGTAAVPEPSSLLLLGTGLFVSAAGLKRKLSR